MRAAGPVRLLGLDPGLQHTGWGVLECTGNHLRHLGDGVISTDTALDLAGRLAVLHRGLNALIEAWQPDEAAVEHTYVNKNPAAALKLGQARGVVLLAPALAGLPVAEYQAMEVKRAVVGTGHAEKRQVEAMVRMLLPGATIRRADAADALAVAICHAHHRQSRVALARAYAP
jgi:crossover junction endodeoxyribonuclease RuvC